MGLLPVWFVSGRICSRPGLLELVYGMACELGHRGMLTTRQQPVPPEIIPIEVAAGFSESWKLLVTGTRRATIRGGREGGRGGWGSGGGAA
jgi:hypothetical protein